jgi:aspartate racemase
MKTLGLIGGTSWVSTADYYRIINQQINHRLGGLNSGRLWLYSFNFEEFLPPADPAGWQRTAAKLIDIALRLQQAGAEGLVLCANTPHLVADIVQQAIAIPLLHIAEATAREISKQGLTRVGLLGTKFTMEQSFFKERLQQAGVTALIPDDAEREFIHSSILGELTRGVFTAVTRQRYLHTIELLVRQGAQAIVFACTEIPLLIQEPDRPVPCFDTTLIHATAAVDFALS